MEFFKYIVKYYKTEPIFNQCLNSQGKIPCFNNKETLEISNTFLVSTSD